MSNCVHSAIGMIILGIYIIHMYIYIYVYIYICTCTSFSCKSVQMLDQFIVGHMFPVKLGDQCTSS